MFLSDANPLPDFISASKSHTEDGRNTKGEGNSHQALDVRREGENDFRDGGGESGSGSNGAGQSEKITRVSVI